MAEWVRITVWRSEMIKGGGNDDKERCIAQACHDLGFGCCVKKKEGLASFTEHIGCKTSLIAKLLGFA